MSDKTRPSARLANGQEWVVRLFISSEQEDDTETTE